MPEAPGHFDVHLHLSRWWPDLPRTGFRPKIDYTVRGLLAEMDDAGIASGLLLPVYEGPTPEESLRESVARARESGGRLRPVATVFPNPGRESVEAVVSGWDAVPELAAIKLFPGYHPFYPHAPALEPVYDYAARRGLPVMIHQGDTLAPNGLIKYARPIEVDEVAVRHRDVRFVLCHFGNPWVEEAAELVYKNENVYADTSGLLAHPSSPYFERAVARAGAVLQGAVDTIGSTRRILYGSDWPLESLRTAVALVEGLEVSGPDRAEILGGNARRLFAAAPAGGRPS
ncbi:MAG TPA: amidohydrolase family protein [Thermoplasmata archaeon]|nr:amidohydrolase family protein [Thermoplasmata archaeon]